MTKPAVVFADAERAIIDYLTPLRTEPVEAFYPTSSTTAPPSLPFVQVAWDGSPTVNYPVTERATVRVTAWAATPTQAKQVCREVLAALYAHPGDANVWNVTPLTGALPSRDPSTGYYLASGTVRVSTRPSLLS